jgi:CheY-like chemotaxis protein
VQRRVLVVDDNPDALKSLFLLVSLMGHDVRQARDGLEAIEAAERFRPEVIFMDLGMPKLNGYEAARRIREESWGQELLIVATTGWGQEDDRRRTKAAGFDQHLVKPVLAGHVHELLAAPPIGRSCNFERTAPAEDGRPASIAQALNVARNLAEQPLK